MRLTPYRYVFFCKSLPRFYSARLPQLKKSIAAGRYPPMPKAYSADLVKVIGQMIRVNPLERPTSTQLLDLPEVAARRHSDWFNKLPAHPVMGEVAMVNTIKVRKTTCYILDTRAVTSQQQTKVLRGLYAKTTPFFFSLSLECARGELWSHTCPSPPPPAFHTLAPRRSRRTSSGCSSPRPASPTNAPTPPRYTNATRRRRMSCTATAAQTISSSSRRG